MTRALSRFDWTRLFKNGLVMLEKIVVQLVNADIHVDRVTIFSKSEIPHSVHANLRIFVKYLC